LAQWDAMGNGDGSQSPAPGKPPILTLKQLEGKKGLTLKLLDPMKKVESRSTKKVERKRTVSPRAQRGGRVRESLDPVQESSPRDRSAQPLIQEAASILKIHLAFPSDPVTRILKVLEARLQEGVTSHDLLLVARAARDKILAGDRTRAWHDLGYLWGPIFPSLLGDAEAPPKQPKGSAPIFRTGLAREEWDAGLRRQAEKDRYAVAAGLVPPSLDALAPMERKEIAESPHQADPRDAPRLPTPPPPPQRQNLTDEIRKMFSRPARPAPNPPPSAREVEGESPPEPEPDRSDPSDGRDPSMSASRLAHELYHGRVLEPGE
jgi:hypothetical protein